MKTHINDYSYSVSTSKGIEKTGIESLSRALSMRRMVAFTASGTTMEYGRPAWVELVNKFIRLAETNHKRLCKRCWGDNPNFPSNSTQIISLDYDDLWEEFASLFKPAYQDKKLRLKYLWETRNDVRDYRNIPKALRNRPDFITSFLTMCEELSTWVIEDESITQKEQLVKVRNQIADEFSKTDLHQFYEVTLNSVGEECRHQNKLGESTLLNETLGHLGIKKKDITKQTDVLKDLYGSFYERKSVDSSGTQRANSDARIMILSHALQLMLEATKEPDTYRVFDAFDLLRPVFKNQLDPLSVIYKELGIKRFLTLNYDIEIERMLATHYANGNDKKHAEFCNFLKQPVSDKAPIKAKRDLANGLQKAIRSATIGEGNLGDLFTFGAFPANFDASVFHLHGRVDDPENMIITQLDYERLYLNSSNHRRSFEEARHAVFNGSDILFVGTGLNESDVIAPLRDFTASHRQMDDVPGRVYALLLSSTSKRYRAENIGLSQTLYKHYGVYTIFIDAGEDEYSRLLRKDRFYLGCLVEKLKYSPTNPVENHFISAKKLKKFVDWAKPQRAHSYFDVNGSERPFEEREISVAYDLLDNVSNGALSKGEDLSLKIPQCLLLRQIIRTLHGRICSRALEEKLNDLAEQRIEWWRRWKVRPDHRIAVYDKSTNTICSKEPLLWIRQKAEYHYPKSTLDDYLQKKSGFYVHYLTELSDLSVETTATQTRIKRVTLPKGGGKGSTVRLLSQPFRLQASLATSDNQDSDRHYYPFEFLFCDNNKKLQPQPYVGGFFAHLTFTLEFTSTIYALVRFICKAANLSSGALTPENICSDTMTRPTGLWLLKEALKALHETPHRVFICLSGIYRLVDEKGDAYSPVHREFFRIISGSKSEETLATRSDKTSVDLLLVALTQQQPIRYLSKEVEQANDDRVPTELSSHIKQYVWRADRRVWLKRWETLAPAKFEQTLQTVELVAHQAFAKILNNKQPLENFSRLLTRQYNTDHAA